MEKYIVKGGNVLKGTVEVYGAKNAALKVLVAACLTSDPVIIHNMPLLADMYVMIDIMRELGAEVELTEHTVKVQMKQFKHTSIPLDKAALARTSFMFMAPLLIREKEATIPNPGGCRLGARPIDRIVEGISHMNTDITYHSDDGYFHATTSGLKGISYTFKKNTHVGTETMILAAVMAEGQTVLENAAEEPEIDDLIALLHAMGGDVQRTAKRQITIHGVTKLHGAEFTIRPDRNEIVTFAMAALITKGDIFIKDAHTVHLDAFYEMLDKVNAGYEIKDGGVRFYYKGELKAADVTTDIHPGFMTDWQAPWAVLMTQASGTSVIHETVFENKLGYIKDLKKMGAKAELFNPVIEHPEQIYNFNLEDDQPGNYHAVKISGPRQLHNAVMTMLDIRAGAAVVLAGLVGKGETSIFGIEKLDRGYERFEERIRALGADIERVKEKV